MAVCAELDENMPPGTPDVSLFSARLRHWRYISTTTDEALRASDGIIPVLLFILLPAVSSFIIFTVHPLQQRINVLFCQPTRQPTCHCSRTSGCTLQWWLFVMMLSSTRRPSMLTQRFCVCYNTGLVTRLCVSAPYI